MLLFLSSCTNNQKIKILKNKIVMMTTILNNNGYELINKIDIAKQKMVYDNIYNHRYIDDSCLSYLVL